MKTKYKIFSKQNFKRVKFSINKFKSSIFFLKFANQIQKFPMAFFSQSKQNEQIYNAQHKDDAQLISVH